jgi:hypothetical protein
MPIIVGSGGTQLSDFSNDHNSWPLYATISNISREIRGKSSYNTLQVVALLPQLPKKQKMNVQVA